METKATAKFVMAQRSSMSYDLYLKSRNGTLDRAIFEVHFSQNRLFEVGADEVAYQNEATGTYFSFAWRDIDMADAQSAEPEPNYPIWFNVNSFGRQRLRWRLLLTS